MKTYDRMMFYTSLYNQRRFYKVLAIKSKIFFLIQRDQKPFQMHEEVGYYILRVMYTMKKRDNTVLQKLLQKRNRKYETNHDTWFSLVVRPAYFLTDRAIFPSKMTRNH